MRAGVLIGSVLNSIFLLLAGTRLGEIFRAAARPELDNILLPDAAELGLNDQVLASVLHLRPFLVAVRDIGANLDESDEPKLGRGLEVVQIVGFGAEAVAYGLGISNSLDQLGVAAVKLLLGKVVQLQKEVVMTLTSISKCSVTTYKGVTPGVGSLLCLLIEFFHFCNSFFWC
jgi:hypothetical protein